MRGYWKNDSTIFASGGEVARGWNEMLSRYKKSYTTLEKMGQLKFDIRQIDFMSADWAKILGAWKLSPQGEKANGAAEPMSRGLYTLIFHRTPDGWRIVHDHTSTANTPSPAPAPPQPASKKKK
jgi:beta-aspartyl-peptidase (threonine type)